MGQDSTVWSSNWNWPWLDITIERTQLPYLYRRLDSSIALAHFMLIMNLSLINDNPLQCSCPENPRDGGAWWAPVYGVAQNQTRLKRLSGSSGGGNNRLRDSSSPAAYIFWILPFSRPQANKWEIRRNKDQCSANYINLTFYQETEM